MTTGFSASRFDSVYPLPFVSLSVKSIASCPGVIGRVANDWYWSQRRASVLAGSSAGGSGRGVGVAVGVAAAVGVVAGSAVGVGAAERQAGSMASRKMSTHVTNSPRVMDKTSPVRHILPLCAVAGNNIL